MARNFKNKVVFRWKDLLAYICAYSAQTVQGILDKCIYENRREFYLSPRQFPGVLPISPPTHVGQIWWTRDGSSRELTICLYLKPIFPLAPSVLWATGFLKSVESEILP